MAFPDVTTLLDDFNRSNENPVDGGVWGGAPRSAVNAVHQVVNNRLTDTARSLHETYYDGVSISGQMQLYFTIVDRNVQGVGIVVTSTIGNADGYIAYQEGNSSGAIYRFDNDTLTSIDTYSGTNINNGAKYGAEFNDNGSTIAIQSYADTGGGWSAISGATVSDATYQGETFYPWVRSLSTSSFLIELDDFRGGQLSSGVDVTPTAISMTMTVVDPTVVLGSIVDTPDAVAMTMTVVDPTVVLGSIVDTPDAVAMTMTVVDPTVLTSGTVVTPAAVAMTMTVVDPTVLTGSAIVTPAAVAMTMTVVDPTVVLGSVVDTPDAVAMTMTVVDPTVALGAIVLTPDAVVMYMGIVDPTATVAYPPEPPTLEIVEADPDACFDAAYQVKVYDWHTEGGGLVGFYDLTGDTINALRYRRVLNGLGSFQITVPLTAANEATLGVYDRLIEIERWHAPGLTHYTELTGLIRHVHRFTDEDDLDWLIVGGYSLEELLNRRVINPDDDPAVAAGYSTKSGPADSVMAALVREQAATSASSARQVPGLTVVPAVGSGQPVGGRWRYENLLEILMSLTAAGAVDFYIERTSGAAVQFVAATVGTDKTKAQNYPGGSWLLFEPNVGTLHGPSLSMDRRQEATYCYLLGQGPEEDREVYENQTSRIKDTPYNRIEIAQDARQVEEGNSLQFLTQALEVLNDKGPILEFEYAITRRQDYRVRWDLGDRVTLRWGSYESSARITEIQVNLTGEEEITPKLEVVT